MGLGQGPCPQVNWTNETHDEMVPLLFPKCWVILEEKGVCVPWKNILEDYKSLEDWSLGQQVSGVKEF